MVIFGNIYKREKHNENRFTQPSVNLDKNISILMKNFKKLQGAP